MKNIIIILKGNILVFPQGNNNNYHYLMKLRKNKFKEKLTSIKLQLKKIKLESYKIKDIISNLLIKFLI